MSRSDTPRPILCRGDLCGGPEPPPGRLHHPLAGERRPVPSHTNELHRPDSDCGVCCVIAIIDSGSGRTIVLIDSQAELLLGQHALHALCALAQIEEERVDSFDMRIYDCGSSMHTTCDCTAMYDCVPSTAKRSTVMIVDFIPCPVECYGKLTWFFTAG